MAEAPSPNALPNAVRRLVLAIAESLELGDYSRFVEPLLDSEPEPEGVKKVRGAASHADRAAGRMVRKILTKDEAVTLGVGVDSPADDNPNETYETVFGASPGTLKNYGTLFAAARRRLDTVNLAAPVPGLPLGYRVFWIWASGQLVLKLEIFEVDRDHHVRNGPFTAVADVTPLLPRDGPEERGTEAALRDEIGTYLQRLRALETMPRERYPRTFDELFQPRRLAYRTHVREGAGSDADVLSPQVAPDRFKELLRQRRGVRHDEVDLTERAWADWREQIHRGVILAHGGVGKTWIVRYEASVRANEAEALLASGSDVISLPFVVPLDEFADAVTGDVNPLDAIVAILRRRFALSDAFFRYAREQLASPAAFIVFDGLDLVPTEHRSAAEEALAVLSVNSQAGILLTCRSEAYDRAPFALAGVEEELLLLPFAAADIEQFIDTWFGADIGAAAALQKRLAQDRGVRALANHPLSLAFLCTLAGREPILASTRASLYEGVLLTYLEGKGRSRKRSKQSSSNTARIEAKLRVLQRVAHELAVGPAGWNYRFSARELIAAMETSSDAVRAVTDRGGAVTAMDLVLHELMVEDSVFQPISVGEGPSSSARYEFFHGSVHEFLVAKHLAEMSEAEWLGAIDEHRWEGRAWEEVIVLLAQLIPGADPLIARLLAEPQDAFHAMLLLAGRCVAEAEPRVSTELREEVIRRLTELLAASSVFDVDRAGRALISMGALAVPVLRAAAQSKNNDRKYREANDIERLFFQMADPVLLDFYKQKIFGEKRKAAAIAIGKVGDPRGITLLVDGLRDWDDYHAQDGESAIEGLAEIPDRRAIWELIGIACGNFKRFEPNRWAAHAWRILSSNRPRRVMNKDAALRRTVETLTDAITRFGLDGLQYAITKTARPKPDLVYTSSKYGPGPRIHRLTFGSESEISESLQAIDAAIHRLHHPPVEDLRAIYGDFHALADDRRLAAKLLVAAAPPEQIDALLWGEVADHRTGKPYRYLEEFVLDALILSGRSEHAPAMRRLLEWADGDLRPNDRLRIARRLFSLDPANALPAVEKLLVEGQGYEPERLAAAEEVFSATGQRTLLVTVLLQIVATSEEKSAERAAERLATLNATEAIPRLRRLLRYGDGYEHDDEITYVELYAERRASAVALGLMRAGDATKDLVNALGDHDAIARNAAEALGRIADKVATAPLRNALRRRGVVELAAIVALQKIGDVATVEAWIQAQAEVLLHGRSWPLSEGRLSTIAVLGTVSALATLTNIAESAEDVEVRRKAIIALQAYPSREQHLRAAVRILQRTSEGKLRSAAVEVIRRWSGPFVVELLLGLLDSSDAPDEAKDEATQLLAYMDVTGFVDALLRSLNKCPRRSFFRLAYLLAQTARGTAAITLAEKIVDDFPSSEYKTTRVRSSAGSYELLMILASEIRRSAPADWPVWQSVLSTITESVAPSMVAGPAE